MTEALRIVDLSTLNGEKVRSLLDNPQVMAILDLEVILRLRELEFVRHGVRNIQADNYMVFSNSIPHKDDPRHWQVSLPPDQQRLFK